MPGLVLAIDPGTTESGWVLYDPVHQRVVDAEIWPNRQFLGPLAYGFQRHGLPGSPGPDDLVVEMIGHYGTGMAPGKEVYDTCVWIGRFVQAWAGGGVGRGEPRLLKRQSVKIHLCGSARAKDPNIRAALIDKLGAPGTKKEPGPTYGIKSHLWAALGVAVAYSEGVR